MEEIIFDKWNEHKKKIHKEESDNFFVNEREIWYTKMWINLWFEQNWKNDYLRPVLVIKKVWNLFFTVALTSKWKNNNFYFKFKDIELNNPKYKDNSFAILSQVKTMDKKRFFENIWTLPEEEFVKIKKKLRDFLL